MVGSILRRFDFFRSYAQFAKQPRIVDLSAMAKIYMLLLVMVIISSDGMVHDTRSTIFVLMKILLGK